MAQAGTTITTKDSAYEKGRRGRMPGYGKVPGSGLKKGQKVITADLKNEILVKGRPLKLLIDVCRGVKIRVGPQAGPGAKYEYPDLRQRIDAARVLLAKVLPDMKHTELSGVDGGPIQQEIQLEAAARVAAIFAQATNGEAVAEKLPDEALHTIQAVNFLQAAQRQAQASRDARPALVEPKPLPAQEVAVAPPEPAPELVPETPSEPEPCPVGHVVAFVESDLTIIGLPPPRDNLPPSYELRRRGMRCRSGNWPVVLEEARKLSGGDLGPWILQAPRAQTGQHYNTREQTITGIRRRASRSG
jgi:hypothetical protein